MRDDRPKPRMFMRESERAGNDFYFSKFENLKKIVFFNHLIEEKEKDNISWKNLICFKNIQFQLTIVQKNFK